MKVSVIKRHVSAYPDPISFKIGEKLAVGEYDTEYPGWVKVRTESGNIGWAPIQYIEVSESALEGVATQEYSAYELTTQLNEELEVSFELNGWYFAKNTQGIWGWVPCEKVTKT